MSEPVTEILIDESLRDDGSPRQMFLVRVPANAGAGPPHLRVVDDGAELGVISAGVMARLMHRYGRPLDSQVEPPGDGLALGAGRSVGRLAFRAAVDAASRDYVVLCEPAREPLAALGRHIATALRHVLARAREERRHVDIAR